MLDCWEHNPKNRPNFATIVTKVEKFIAHDKGYVDFSELHPEYVFPPIRQHMAIFQYRSSYNK